MTKLSANCAIFTVLPILIFLFVCSSSASDQIPAAKQSHPILLRGGAIHVVSGADIENGSILFENGVITAVGTNLTVPDDTEIIDLAGKHVYPGLISTNTSLGLVEIGAVRSTRDLAETGEYNPNVRAEVSFNPDSELLPVTRSNGIMLALSVPLGGIISGTSALMMLDGWTWESMILKAPVGLHLRWPKMIVKQSPRAKKSVKERLKERNEKIAKIKETFASARAYRKAKEVEAERGIPYHDTDLRWEAMISVLKKEIPLFVHANEIQQIQAALDFVTEQNIKAVLVGGYDAWRAADQLRKMNVPVIITGIHRLPMRRWAPYDEPFTLPAKLHAAGIQYCIATAGGGFESAHERNLPYHAGTAAAYGLSKDEALKAITLYPAQILGIADRVGSLAAGKDATLIITDGDPLEIMTHVNAAFIQGRKIDLSNRHTELYRKYKTKIERLHAEGK